MNTIVDIVCEKLFEEIAAEYKNYQELSDNVLATLNCIYGQPLLPALDLVDRRCVTRISSPNPSEIYQVVGNSGRVYTCSSSLQFCPCMSFQYGVINRKELITIMDLSTTVIFLIIFVSVWVKLSSFSFLFCVCLSCIAVCILIYLLLITETLLPIEQPLLHQFIKDSKIEKKSANENLEANERESNYDDEISRKLRELIGHIVRDFILDWYNTVSDDVHFVQEAFELFEYIFTEVRDRVSLIDSNKLTLILLSRLTHHYSCYKKALEYSGPNQHDSQRREQLIVVSYEKLNGHLAMSNPPDTEKDHIRAIVAVLLKGLLPKDYILNGCALYLVRELISQNVLSAIVDMLSDPNWINSVIPRILDDDVIADDDDVSESDDVSDRGSDTSGESRTSVVTDENNTEVNGAGNREVDTNVNTPTEKFQFFDNIPNLNVRFSTIENMIEQHDNNDDDDQRPTTSQTQSEQMKQDRNSSIISHRSQSTASETEVDENLPMSANQSHFATKTDSSFPHSFVSTKLLRTAEESTSQKFFTQEKSLFQRLRITEAINIEENFDGGTKYTLYKIKYYAPSVKSSESSTDAESQLEEFQVQRRFREFLTLQDNLNENKLVRKIIAKVKGPSRMFPMPIGNMDKEYIEKRRKFLQAYIRELCFYVEVAGCRELRDFLAYKSDPRIAYVRRPTEYIPRFDKMLKNAFQELIGSASSKINETFQNDSQKLIPLEESKIIATEPIPVPTPQTNADSHSNAIEPQLNFSQQSKLRGPVTMLKSIVYGKTTDLSVYESGLRDYQCFDGPKNANEMTFGWKLPGIILLNRTRSHKPCSSARRTQADGCDHSSNDADSSADLHQYAVPGQIFNLAYHVWGIKLGIHTLSFLAVARFVKEFVAIKIKQLTRKEMWVHYLQILQRSLWPDGKWENQTNFSSDPDINRAKAQKSLEEAFPGVLKHVVGDMEYSIGVKELLDSFQNPNVNRHLIFHLIDILLQTLFPDLQNIIHNRRNISL